MAILDAETQDVQVKKINSQDPKGKKKKKKGT